MKTFALSLVAGTLLVAFAAAPVQAQQQPAPAPQQQDVPELEEETLETFAQAYLEVGEVRMELQNELQTTQDQEEANRIQQEANNRMQEVLESHGMTVQDYQQVTQVLNSDPEQRQEFEALVEEIQEENGAGQP